MHDHKPRATRIRDFPLSGLVRSSAWCMNRACTSWRAFIRRSLARSQAGHPTSDKRAAH